MRRGALFRPLAKWGCALSCALILVAYVVGASGRFGRALYGPFGWIGVSQGVLIVAWQPTSRLPWHLGSCGLQRSGLQWWFHAGAFRTAPGWWIAIPMWILLLLVAVPAAHLWRPARKKPHHCASCGYDLTGNTSGRCPECGLSR